MSKSSVVSIDRVESPREPTDQAVASRDQGRRQSIRIEDRDRVTGLLIGGGIGSLATTSHPCREPRGHGSHRPRGPPGERRPMLDFALVLYLITLSNASLTPDPTALHHAAARANQVSHGRQEQVALAAAGNSSFVVWSSARQEAGSSGIYGRVFDPLARPLTPEVHLNETLVGNQDHPAVAALPDGTGAWAVWQSSGPGGTRIVARGFDAALLPTSPEIWLEDSVEGIASSPVIDVSEGGRALAAWVAHPRADRPGGQVRGRLLAPSGGPLGPALHLSNGDADALPTVVSLPDERFLVAWAGRAPDGLAGLQARFVSAANGEMSETMQLVEAVHPECPPIEPSLDAAADGRFVAAWMQCETGRHGMGRHGMGGYGVWHRRFDARGVPTGACSSKRRGGLGLEERRCRDRGAGRPRRLELQPRRRQRSGPVDASLHGRRPAPGWTAAGDAGEPGAPPHTDSQRRPASRLDRRRAARLGVAGHIERGLLWRSPDVVDPGRARAPCQPGYGDPDTGMPDPCPERSAEAVASAALAPIPPFWNPDFEPQQAARRPAARRSTSGSRRSCRLPGRRRTRKWRSGLRCCSS